MLLLRMRCGLGNQMFQYAAVRALAQRLGCAFAYTGDRVKWTSHLRLALQRRRPLVLAPRFDLDQWFLLGGSGRWANQWQVQRFRLRYGFVPKQYVEPIIDCGSSIRELTRFDPAFFDVNPGTEILGFFQSESYFRDCRHLVKSWFTPQPQFVQAARVAAQSTGVPEEQRCCIHVRRGDYLSMRNGGASDGWALPRTYYDNALATLPRGLKFVVVTDDPEWARDEFSALAPQIFSHRDQSIIDLLILAECRVNIIANSSFSWWGAYLNDQPGREVLFPKHFLGWAFQTELPQGISVAEWKAIPAL